VPPPPRGPLGGRPPPPPPLDTPLEPAKWLAFSRDHNFLATIDRNGLNANLHVWNRNTGKRIHYASLGMDRNLGLLSFTPDGKTLLCGGTSQILAIDTATGKRTEHAFAAGYGPAPPWGAIAVVELSPDGKTVAHTVPSSERGHGSIALWDWHA